MTKLATIKTAIRYERNRPIRNSEQELGTTLTSIFGFLSFTWFLNYVFLVGQPTMEPTQQPSAQPSAQPVMRPSCQPSRFVSIYIVVNVVFSV